MKNSKAKLIKMTIVYWMTWTERTSEDTNVVTSRSSVDKIKVNMY